MDEDDLSVSVQDILAEMDDAGLTKFKLAQQVAVNKRLMELLKTAREDKTSG